MGNGLPTVDPKAMTIAAALEGGTPPPLEALRFDERYEVLKHLRRGGMGDVRLHRDRVIGREIALKKLRDDFALDPRDEARFLREARVQGQLEHPAIVPVYEIGRDAAGAAYFAMKHVRGMTLEEMIDAVRASDPAAVRPARRRLLNAFSNVCLAVDFAHKRGVLHRDLKPGNVMLGDFGEVYVLDWGLAKVVDEEGVPRPPESGAPVDVASDPSHRTAAGATLGTPGYMSPEQVSGDPLDERSDVYALGLLLFEILALEPLHRGQTVRELHTSTLKGGDARPTTRQAGRDVAPELEAVCVRATALDPRDRYATARELYEAVERYLDGDRDLTRRRELADEYATLAAGRALVVDSAEERSRALSEVGRALALDPTNTLAMTTLVRLLSEPPKTLPQAARQELAAAGRRTAEVFSRSGPLGLVLALACLPLFIWLGVRSWPAIAAVVVLWGALGWVRRWPVRSDSDGTLPYGVPLAAFAAAGFSSLLFGPFVLVPAIATVLAINASLAPGRSRRTLITTLAIASWVVPWALQRVGVIPGGLVVEAGSFTVLPAAVAFRPVATEVALIATNLGVMLIGMTIANRLRQRLLDAERGRVLQAWQLQQLIPPEASTPSLRAPR